MSGGMGGVGTSPRTGDTGRVDETEAPASTDSTGSSTSTSTTAPRTAAPRPPIADPMGAAIGAALSSRLDERRAQSLGTFGESPASYEIEVTTDGRLVARGAQASDPQVRMQALNALTLRPENGPGPFDRVTDKALLESIATRLTEEHRALAADPPDDARRLEWRQGRAATLHLLEAAALRAKQLGDPALAQRLSTKLVDTAKAEPWRQVRDFAFESMLTRSEAGDIPKAAVTQAREALYPAKPPYDKWLQDGKIRIQMYVDNDGSLLSSQISHYRSLGFTDRAHADGSHTLTLKARGEKPEVQIHIPKPADKSKGESPALFEKMNDPSIDMIAYTGHAGYGQRVDHALAQGVGGSGDGKAVALFQCWGEGNVESLERAFPDAQVISTTASTRDTFDWHAMDQMIHGFREKKGWDEMKQKTVSAIGRYRDWEDFGGDQKKIDGHYFFPTTRSTLVKKYDRDGDGTNDEKDHVFNVVYPKRIDAAGGFDPVSQAIPKYALDGTNLNKAVDATSLITRWDHLLPPSQESRLPWKPELWKPGGFFDPAEGDLRAFRFTQDPRSGEVSVALSTRFAHTQDEELTRMLAYEAGLWMGDKAGLAGADKTAFALGMLERAIEKRPSGAAMSGTMDESFAEEKLFKKRYGLPESFTFQELKTAAGDDHDYTPASYQRVAALVRGRAGMAEAAARAPSRVGDPIALPPDRDLRFPSSYIDKNEHVETVLRGLGIDGTVEAYSHRWLNQNQPNNMVATVRGRDGKSFQVGISTDSQGVVRSAARVDIGADALAEKAATDYLKYVATETRLPEAELRRAYDAARRQKTVGESMNAALDIAARRAPGTNLNRPSELSRLGRLGLLSPAEYEKVDHFIAQRF